MATLLADARNDLRRAKDVYLESSQSYDRIVEKADILAKLSEDDADAVPALANSYISDYEAPADSFSALIIAVLQEFSETIRSTASSVSELAFDLDTWMRMQSPRVAIKNRGTIIDAAVDGGGNTGTQTLVLNTLLADGTVNESANIDNVEYTLQQRAQSLAQLGQDIWSVKGTARGEVSEFDGPGSGVVEGSLSSIGPGRTNFFTNPSFDQSFLTGGAGSAKIPGCTITAGDAFIALDRTNVAENRGGNPGSLLITGACTITIDFVALGIALSEILPYILGIRAETDGNADFTLTLASAGAANPLTGTFNIVGATAWDEYLVSPDTANAWRETFDETGRPILTINVTSVASQLWLDDLILDTLPVVGGVPSGIIGGLTTPGLDDTHTSNRRLTVASGVQAFSGGAAGDTVDSIVVGGVELLREAIPFTTDLTTTVGLVRDAINQVPTGPDYSAASSVGNLTLSQRKPVEGTITVVVTVTDNGGGLSVVDADLTGATIGEIADMFARHIGFVPSHDTVATSGWED